MRLKSSQINAVIILAICGLLAMATFSIGRSSETNKGVQDFSYEDFKGNTGHLYQFSNQPVILHFWASWCLPCRDELPRLMDKARKTPATAYLLISVDQNKADMLGMLKPFLAQLPSNIMVIDDPEAKITKEVFDIDLFPETIILNNNKTLQQHIIGPADWSSRP